MATTVKKYGRIYIKDFYSCPVFLNFFTWFQIFFRDCVSKYIFGHNSTQSPPNFSFMVFPKLQNLTSIFKNIKQLSCVSILNLMVLCKLYFTDLIKDFRKLSTLLIGSFSIELFFFWSRWVLYSETWVIIGYVESKTKISRPS